MTALDDRTPGIDPSGERHATQERLVERYAETCDAEHVRSVVSDAFTRLSDARVTAFLPVLVERAVRRSLPA